MGTALRLQASLPAAAALALLLGAAPPAGAQSALPGALLQVNYRGVVSTSLIAELARPLFQGFEGPTCRFAVDTYRLRYGSTDFDGSEAVIQAELFVPKVPKPDRRPLCVFASGTTGIDDSCAPSLEQPEVRRWGHYRANLLSYAASGFIVVFPDYLGFNDPERPQRYFSKQAEAHVLLDAVRAVQAFFASHPQGVAFSGAVFLAGYSQGGHAVFAASDLRASYAPEVPLTGIIGFAATTDVTTLLKEGAYYAPYIFYGYSAMYGREEIDPGDYLQERWSRTLEADVKRMCVDQFQAYYPFDGKKLYRPEFYEALHRDRLERDYPILAAVLAANKSGTSGHFPPALVVQGGADIIVTTASQSRFVEELRRAGGEVRYLVLKGVRHRDTRPAAFRASVEWMESLAAR